MIIYSDAARSDADIVQVQAVRSIIRSVDGFKSVSIIERENNLGLAQNIIQGVSEVLKAVEQVVVMEDDLITSPHFLTYMNNALQQYADDDRVVCIHGYVLPVDEKLPEAFFLRGADCWGWATWRSGWASFNEDGEQLLRELKRRKLTREFDFNNSFPYTKMLKEQTKGINNSWAVRWHASAFLTGKLTLYPGRSLVHNIGIDGSGTHSGEIDHLDVELSETGINLDDLAVEPSIAGTAAVEAFYRKQKVGLIRRLFRKLHSIMVGWR